MVNQSKQLRLYPVRAEDMRRYAGQSGQVGYVDCQTAPIVLSYLYAVSFQTTTQLNSAQGMLKVRRHALWRFRV